MENCWLTGRQIEAARQAVSRYMKREGKIWIRIFPHLAKTKKPAEVRMGSGKGSPEDWVAVVREGCCMFEIAGVADFNRRIEKAQGEFKPLKNELKKQIIS